MANKIATTIKKRIPNNRIVELLPLSCHYEGKNYGMRANLMGKGVNICIVDSGASTHKDIVNIQHSINLSENSLSVDDVFGHSTVLAGILGANNKNAIVGVAPECNLFFTKVINDNDRSCSFNALVAGILWAIVKEVDIILISLGTTIYYPVFYDAIKKAYDSDICVIAANSNSKSEDVNYPAKYDEVLAVSQAKGKQKAYSHANGVQITLPKKDIYSTDDISP